jgi:diguanylate cyclase (GGDEF)-like protein/PAS domain S-box-containing protein
MADASSHPAEQSAAEFAERIPDVGYLFQVLPEQKFLYVSPSVIELVGFTPEEHYADPGLGMRLVDPRDVGTLAAAVTAAAEATPGQPSDFTVRWIAKSGRIVWTQHRCSSIVREDGSVVVCGVARDVTAEQERLLHLTAAEAEARLTLDNASYVILRYAADGTLLWASPSLKRVFGLDPADAIGTKLRLGLPEDRERVEQEVLRAIAEHRDESQVRMRFTRADGSLGWVDFTTRFVRPGQDDPTVSVAMAQDVTAEVEALQALVASEEGYRRLAENASDVVFQATLDMRVTWVSPSVFDLLGWTPEEVVGQSGPEFLHPDDAQRIMTGRSASDPTERLSYDARFRVADGSYRWLQVTARPILDADGAVIGRVGSWRDINAEVVARQGLTQSERLFRLAMESAPTGMALVDLDRRFTEVNPEFCRMLDRDREWLLAHRVPDVLDPVDDALDLRMRARVLSGAAIGDTAEKRLRRADGSAIWVNHSVGVLRDDTGVPLSYVSQFVNVTKERKAQERLEFMATHDALTSLANRGAMLSWMDHAMRRVPRVGTRIGVLFLDLDDLKPINDTYGHAAGDTLLVRVAEILRASVRADDFVARHGGDEFVIALPALTDIADAARVADKIHAALKTPVIVDGHPVRATVSIGVAVAEPTGTPEEALRRADAALYRAKRAGGAATAAYDPQLDETEPLS